MKNLLKAITKYLNEDVVKLQELEKGLTEEINKLKATKKVEDSTAKEIEEILNERINLVESAIQDIKNRFNTEKEMFLTLYGDRIKRVINIYSKLKKVDYKLGNYGLESYAHLLERDSKTENNWNKCHLEFKVRHIYLYFHEKSEQYYEEQKVLIDSTFYVALDLETKELVLGIDNRNQFTCDNAYTLALKDLLTIQRLAKKFERLEEIANGIVEEILGRR